MQSKSLKNPYEEVSFSKVIGWEPATLLKINFFICIFLRFWLQISEQLFSITTHSGCLYWIKKMLDVKHRLLQIIEICTNLHETRQQTLYSMHKKRITSLSGETNKFWKIIKTIFLTKTKEPPAQSFNIDANCTTNNKSIASRFCLFFSKIASALKEKSIRFTNFI